jgi:pimeloyl-ACP methyl ester carboxylesterase
VALPLTLRKVETVSERRRPQTPKPPFPYKVEEIAYASKAGGVRLAGTLTLPEGKGPFAAVVMITGSGPQDRDETIVGHKPFLVIADALTRRGIAVLRSDDRGFGRSTGDFASATTADFADDAEGGLIYLKMRPEIDARRIGLLGHSEGGVSGPMVAARVPKDVAFLVLMAGTGVSGETLSIAQQDSMLRAAGANEDDIKKTDDLLRKLLPTVLREKDPKVIDAKLRATVNTWLESLPESACKEIADQGIPAMVVGRLSSPWLRFFLALDPREVLHQVKCPVLAINGELDSQVDYRENLKGIAKALKDSGNHQVTTRSFPHLNHLFQACKTGALSEYARIEETVNPAALTTITDWVAERTAKP